MFKVGDRIKIFRKIDDWKMESSSYMNTWTDSMDNLIGEEWTIEWIGEREFGIEDSIYNFPIECAELAEDTSKHHPHQDIIIAWAKGAEIEFQDPATGNWHPYRPHFSSHYDLRIKPENQNADSIKQIEKEMRRLADKLKGLLDTGGNK